MDDPERRELYMELRQEAGVAAQFNRASEDVFANGEEVEKEETLAVSKSQSVSECVFVWGGGGGGEEGRRLEISDCECKVPPPLPPHLLCHSRSHLFMSCVDLLFNDSFSIV